MLAMQSFLVQMLKEKLQATGDVLITLDRSLYSFTFVIFLVSEHLYLTR